VRGSGESDKPGRRDAYRLAQLVDDLGAVLDAVSPARPVHLLGHDWGSIQAWAGVCDPRFATRVSSYTSISGPSLDHAGQWMREAGRHPGATARQLLDSYYIGLFHIPGLAEMMWRSGRLMSCDFGENAGVRPKFHGIAASREDRGSRHRAFANTNHDRVESFQRFAAYLFQKLAWCAETFDVVVGVHVDTRSAVALGVTQGPDARASHLSHKLGRAAPLFPQVPGAGVRTVGSRLHRDRQEGERELSAHVALASRDRGGGVRRPQMS